MSGLLTSTQYGRLLQEQLHALLLPWGINTKAVDRYVVSQQSQAVAAASDPVALVSHLELLLGTAGACLWVPNVCVAMHDPDKVSYEAWQDKL